MLEESIKNFDPAPRFQRKVRGLKIAMEKLYGGTGGWDASIFEPKLEVEREAVAQMSDEDLVREVLAGRIVIGDDNVVRNGVAPLSVLNTDDLPHIIALLDEIEKRKLEKNWGIREGLLAELQGRSAAHQQGLPKPPDTES